MNDRTCQNTNVIVRRASNIREYLKSETSISRVLPAIARPSMKPLCADDTEAMATTETSSLATDARTLAGACISAMGLRRMTRSLSATYSHNCGGGSTPFVMHSATSSR